MTFPEICPINIPSNLKSLITNKYMVTLASTKKYTKLAITLCFGCICHLSWFCVKIKIPLVTIAKIASKKLIFYHNHQVEKKKRYR